VGLGLEGDVDLLLVEGLGGNLEVPVA